jgi:opacity protein-like surface antigen
MQFKKLITLTFLLLPLTALASGLEPVSRGEFGEATLHKPYLSFELGYSSSLKGNLSVDENKNPISSFVWDHPLEGWNSDLNHTAVYGVNFGYNLSRFVALELAYNYRPSFQYEKYQTVPTSSAIGARNRCFDLANHTFMLNSVYHLAAIASGLQSIQERTGIEPFLNLGAGVAKNTVSNFYGVSLDKQPGLIFSKMVDKTNYDFAAQAGAGLNVIFNPNWALKLGYRFVYAGKFKTQDYVTDDPDHHYPTILGAGCAANAWSGTLKTNEGYAALSYTF